LQRAEVSIAFAVFAVLATLAQAEEIVVDLQTRAGVTQRFIYVASESTPKAAAVLLAGGHGSIKIFPNGTLGWGDRGFLVRTRGLLAQQGIAVAVLDAPSDKRSGLGGFRHTAEHAADIGAALAWMRQKTGVPVWLIGHSRGTESAASAALSLGAAPSGPDGLILAAPILTESAFVTGKAVTHFPVERLRVPLLVLHHEADSCSVTLPRDLPLLVSKVAETPIRKSFVSLTGGSAKGGPCEHESHHGFGGIDLPGVQAMSEFILRSAEAR
jgi:hypothetical protein